MSKTIQKRYSIGTDVADGSTDHFLIRFVNLLSSILPVAIPARLQMLIHQTTLHPATVHFPIALLLVGSLAGLLYLWWQPRLELRVLTWWLLMLGWIGAGVAAITGLLAQGNLPPQAPYVDVLNKHISSGLAMIAVYALIFYRVWLFRNRRRPADPIDLLDVRSARLSLTLLFVLGIGLVVIGGWLGGELVYTWGVNVWVD